MRNLLCICVLALAACTPPRDVMTSRVRKMVGADLGAVQFWSPAHRLRFEIVTDSTETYIEDRGTVISTRTHVAERIVVRRNTPGVLDRTARGKAGEILFVDFGNGARIPFRADTTRYGDGAYHVSGKWLRDSRGQEVFTVSIDSTRYACRVVGDERLWYRHIDTRARDEHRRRATGVKVK